MESGRDTLSLIDVDNHIIQTCPCMIYNVREQLRDTSDVRICVNNDRIPVHVTIESCACPFLQDGGGSRPELRDGVLDAL